MSRALDSRTAASISAGNCQAAYNDVVEALNSNASGLVNIEFLVKSHPLPPGCNVLMDGTNIGIPKVTLVQAFIVARQLFFKSVEHFKDENFEAIRDSSAVILLMDPEHITAANSRKNIIQHLRAVYAIDLQSVLRRELMVIDSFLTSRLHRHTKSPTLWGHRRWILEILDSLNFHRDLQQDLESVVLIAAERHPRNYYAWLHLRWLFQGLHGSGSGSGTFDNVKIQSVVKKWCLMHPSDISGWSFLLFYLSYIELPSTQLDTRSAICKEVLSVATSFNWTHESVWVFLRTLVANEDIQENQRQSFLKTIESFSSIQPEVPKARIILNAAND